MAKAKEKKEKVKDNKKNKPVEKKVKKEGFFKSVRAEFKKVRWPNKKEMIKYSIRIRIILWNILLSNRSNDVGFKEFIIKGDKELWKNNGM